MVNEPYLNDIKTCDWVWENWLIYMHFYYFEIYQFACSYNSAVVSNRSMGLYWDPVNKKAPRDTPSSNHMPNKSPHQSQTITQESSRCSGYMPSYLKPPEVPHYLFWFLGVLHGQEKPCGKQTWPSLVILSLYFDSVRDSNIFEN